MKSHIKLLIGLVLGIFAGTLLHPWVDDPRLSFLSAHVLGPIGQIFLRMIFMVVVPMVFSALVIGVFELGKSHGLGRIASKTLIYTLIASSASVAIGIGLVNLLRPGAGFQIDPAMVSSQTGSVEAIQKNAASAKPLSQTLVEMVPKNPLDSAVRALDGEMLSLMVFALIFGLALSQVSRRFEGSNIILVGLEQLFAISMRIVEYAMKLAPLAVFAIVFNTAFKFGYEVFGSLLYYVAVVVVGLLLQQFVVYTVLLKAVARRNPTEFFKQCREVLLYAFSTASSNATLPRSLETAEQKLKIPTQVSRFVLTVGSTANQNGTALFEGVTVLFLAQVYGVDLTFAQQIQVVVMSIVAGIGTAGVPGGSLPLIMILLQSVGIPPEGLGIVLGVDRFLDMCRTTLNVSGDLVIAAMVGRGEPDLEAPQTL